MKYPRELIPGLALGLSIVALVVGLTAYATRTPQPSNNSDTHSNSGVVPNPGYVAPKEDPQDSYTSGDGDVSSLDYASIDYAYIDPATGHLTRIVNNNAQVVFDNGYADTDQEVAYQPLGGQFGASNMMKTTVTDPKGQQTTLNTTFYSQTQAGDPLLYVPFYNQHVAKPINPSAPPMEYLPDLGGMVSDYTQSVIATAIQNGTIAAPIYAAVGSPLTISDGNGSTCTQETVALTNQADLQKQLDAVIGAPDLIATSISNSAGSVTIPNTENCQTLLAQAQGQSKGGTFPAPPGFTDQGESGTSGSTGGSGSSSDDGTTSGGQVSGGTEAGTNILCPIPQTGWVTYTCQAG